MAGREFGPSGYWNAGMVLGGVDVGQTHRSFERFSAPATYKFMEYSYEIRGNYYTAVGNGRLPVGFRHHVNVRLHTAPPGCAIISEAQVNQSRYLDPQMSLHGGISGKSWRSLYPQP